MAFAVSAGADAVGVVFAPSQRRVQLAQAAAALSAAPPPVARIGVFVDESDEFIFQAVAACGLHAVQLHGGPPVSARAPFPVPVVSVVAVGKGFTWDQVPARAAGAAAVLLDTLVAGASGGTAQQFAWDEVGPVRGEAPVFVAGGLRPDNVGACIAAMRPYAVDVSSGVEAAPGIKDHGRIEQFMRAVRAADEEVYTR